MLPYCDVAHVTKIDHAYEADAYFPDLDSDPEWEITADSDEQVYFDITYQFLKYDRILDLIIRIFGLKMTSLRRRGSQRI